MRSVPWQTVHTRSSSALPSPSGRSLSAARRDGGPAKEQTRSSPPARKWIARGQPINLLYFLVLVSLSLVFHFREAQIGNPAATAGGLCGIAHGGLDFGERLFFLHHA